MTADDFDLSEWRQAMGPPPTPEPRRHERRRGAVDGVPYCAACGLDLVNPEVADAPCGPPYLLPPHGACANCGEAIGNDPVNVVETVDYAYHIVCPDGLHTTTIAKLRP